MVTQTIKKISRSQAVNLAENLKWLLNERGISEATLAKALGLTPMSIWRLTSGETTDPRLSTLQALADYFNITLDALIGRTIAPSKEEIQLQPQFIPVFDWETVASGGLQQIDLKMWEKWHPVLLGDRFQISKKAFALESKPSMQPRFPIGTIFIVDPEKEPKDGNVILLKCTKTHNLTLRDLVIDPPKWILRPVIADSIVVTYSKTEYEIIGVVVLSMLYGVNE